MQWRLTNLTKYTLIPLPPLRGIPFTRHVPSPSWESHDYPYPNLPSLESHNAPPFAVIDECLKCAGADINVITLDYLQHLTSEEQDRLRHGLGLLSQIRALFQGAK